MTTQEIKNMNLDKTQVSKMMLGSYQVWPHVEIDYGPEVPEIEGDYLAFATYGEADISFKACGVTRDYFSGQLDFNVIYSYDGITWNDFGYSYTLADENENHKVYTFDKVHITKDTPVYIKRSTPGTLLCPSRLQLLDETPPMRDMWDDKEDYDWVEDPETLIDEDGQTFSFTMSGDYVFCSGKLKAWMDFDLFNFDVRPWHAELPCFSQLFRGCKNLRTADIEFQFSYLCKSMYGCMFLDCTSLIAGPKKFDFSNIKYTFFDTVFNEERGDDYRSVFWMMFKGCTSLVKAPVFVGEFRSHESCFASMFKDCTSLILPPSLKNVTPNSYLFNAMFKRCTSLIKIPELPNDDRVGEKMYNRMFEGCTSLKSVTILPATKLLGAKCYEYMFKDCTSLVKAPELPATELSDNCYQYMFEGCTSLTKAPKLPAITLAYHCYHDMFRNCTSLRHAPEIHATTLANYCCYKMFENCTSLVKAPELPATTLADNCYQYMFEGCTSLTKAPELPATTLAWHCYASMFEGCTSLTTAPELPATFVENYSYQNMFLYSGINNLPSLEHVTDIDDYGCVGMFSNCNNIKQSSSESFIIKANLSPSACKRMFEYSSVDRVALQSKKLYEDCYAAMFVGSTVKVVTMLATEATENAWKPASPGTYSYYHPFIAQQSKPGPYTAYEYIGWLDDVPPGHIILNNNRPADWNFNKLSIPTGWTSSTVTV